MGAAIALLGCYAPLAVISITFYLIAVFSHRSGIICNSPLFKFLSKPRALFLEDQRCETRRKEPDPQDYLLLSLINYLMAVNEKQITNTLHKELT